MSPRAGGRVPLQGCRLLGACEDRGAFTPNLGEGRLWHELASPVQFSVLMVCARGICVCAVPWSVCVHVCMVFSMQRCVYLYEPVCVHGVCSLRCVSVYLCMYACMVCTAWCVCVCVCMQACVARSRSICVPVSVSMYREGASWIVCACLRVRVSIACSLEHVCTCVGGMFSGVCACLSSVCPCAFGVFSKCTCACIYSPCSPGVCVCVFLDPLQQHENLPNVLFA